MAVNRLDRRPGELVVVGFALFILLGAILLWLPVSHTGVRPVTFYDAVFTAASAVTVTGLAVVDTGTTWSLFGEMVILVLIQVGGLGIMTLAGFVGLIFNRRLGLRGGRLAGAEMGYEDLGVLRPLIRRLVVFVFTTELVVTLLLAARFWSNDEFGLVGSIHQALFHSVSAFNNAGFSTLDLGLERYSTDWFVSLVISASIIIGGLGFPVVFEMTDNWRRPGRWSLHTKVTVTVTSALLIGGTALFLFLEWSNPATMGELGPVDKVVAAFFQSTTTRTAGFNTVPTGALTEPSLLLTILLMVIGASSASTGGGIKTSTLAIVVGSFVSELRGDKATSLFNRQMPSVLERQALSLVIAALGAVGTSAFVLSYLHPHIPVIDLLFESASAFATAGLSTGITAELGGAARLVIIGLMFLGRVGPTTFGAAVLLRPHKRRYNYAEEGVIVG